MYVIPPSLNIKESSVYVYYINFQQNENSAKELENLNKQTNKKK